jgi:hypothetical protein
MVTGVIKSRHLRAVLKNCPLMIVRGLSTAAVNVNCVWRVSKSERGKNLN